VRTFGCTTPELQEMAVWLKQCGIRSVVMESTGVYWVPVYQVLEDAGFEVYLVDAHHAKNVPGRKTDVWDCRWIRKLHTYGLLRGCFIPPADVLA
jgi:transposase